MRLLRQFIMDLGEALMTEYHKTPGREWFLASEQLPEPYPQRIAVRLRTGKIVATHMGYDMIHGPFWSGIKNWFDVTHWTPLPADPKSE